MAVALVSGKVSPHARQRLLEIFPGGITWAVLATPVLLAFLIRFNDPSLLWIMGLGAILLDCYWFIRTAVTVRGVRRTLAAVREVEGTDWAARYRELVAARGAGEEGAITQCALIPTYTEKYEVLKGTVAALAAQQYPASQKVCAIITRETDLGGIENVRRLREEYGAGFAAFIHIRDPLLPGIVVGKSAAMAYAGPVLRKACDEMGLDPRRTLVTDLDSDFRLHPQYFAYIACQFHTVEEPLTSIWQPIPVFMNNLWRVPAAIRVMATAATQWQMFLHQHPERLVMFSSYTMSLHMLSEVGYWDDDVIPEDSRFFWKSFFHYGEHLHVRPAFMTVSGDAPRSRDYAGSHVTQYNQIKRWAWGATDIPYVSKRMVEHPEIPLKLRLRRFRYLLFNHLSWATVPLLLLFGGALPTMVDLDYSLSLFATVIDWTTFGILTLTFLNTLALIQVDHVMCPKPAAWSWLRRRYADFQLFLYPIAALALSVIPALEAQTRLMFGAYLEYTVTDKE